MKKLLSKLTIPLIWLSKKIDFQDLAFLLGLSLLFYGIYLEKPPWAFIVAGALLMVVSYAGQAVGLICTMLSAARGQKR